MIRKLSVLICACFFLVPSAAEASLAPMHDLGHFKVLDNTVNRILTHPRKYSANKRSNRAKAKAQIRRSLKNLKRKVWSRHGKRLQSDKISEAFAKAILEKNEAAKYKSNSAYLVKPMRRIGRLSSKIPKVKKRKCPKGKKKNAKRKRKHCKRRKRKKIIRHRKQVRRLEKGVEEYRQAFLSAYLQGLQTAARSVTSMTIRNRAASNESTVSELAIATRVANKGRKALGLALLPDPKPQMDLPNTAQSEFYGMMHSGNIDYKRAAESGVGLTRQGIWFDYTKHRVDWKSLDSAFQRSARYGVRSIGVICPASRSGWDWGSRSLGRILKHVRTAVKRYGSNGQFWKDNPGIPRMPVRVWEICNEPNLAHNNPGGKKVRFRAYVSMMIRVSRLIRRADPSSVVLVGGLANVSAGKRRMSAETFLSKLYSSPGARTAFDGVSLHPYSNTVEGVKSSVLRIRKIMDMNGDSKKGIWITEVGWATDNHSSRSSKYLVVSEAAQARNLTEVMTWLRSNRISLNISAVFWYFWKDSSAGLMSSTPDWYNYAGLFDVNNRPKPSWLAWLKFTGGQG